MGTILPVTVANDVAKKFKSKKAITTAGKTIETGMSFFGTDMARSTHYNTKEELDAARKEIHDQLFLMDRSIYGCLACIPGVTDNTKSTVVEKLLSNPWLNDNTSLLTMDIERGIIDDIVASLPPNRMINLFDSFTDSKINNKRTVKTVLPFILNSPNLEWWSVKYRRKLKRALSHCWGKRKTSIIGSILNKTSRTDKEKGILKENIGKHLVVPNATYVCECIAFVLASREPSTYKARLFNAYYASRVVFSKAKGLPKEIIEGIRSTYHPDIQKDETLKVAIGSMTSKEKKLVQRQAKTAGVKVEWDPKTQPLVDLIIYGLEMGFNMDINIAIGQKAKRAAEALPFRYENVGIICDDSFSMSGSADQKKKALATAYATVEMLKRVSTKMYHIKTTSGREFYIQNQPTDESDLATPFIQLLKLEPDVIFVVSDGYENAPEGRFNEVLKIARDKLDLNTPVYHFNPVAAAESKVALKRLSNDIPLTPVSNPEKMGLTLFKTMLAVDPKSGILELFNMILPQVEKSKELYARKAIVVKEKKVKEIA